MNRSELDARTVDITLGTVLKYREDQERVRGVGVERIVEAAEPVGDATEPQSDLVVVGFAASAAATPDSTFRRIDRRVRRRARSRGCRATGRCVLGRPGHVGTAAEDFPTYDRLFAGCLAGAVDLVLAPWIRW